MDRTGERTNEALPLSGIIRELVASVSGLVRSEIKLAKAEVTRNTKDLLRQAGMIALLGTVAGLGCVALLICAIIGLGHLLDESYGWSAMIIGLALLIPSGILIFNAVKRIRRDVEFSTIRHSLEDDRDLLTRKMDDLTEGGPGNPRVVS